MFKFDSVPSIQFCELCDQSTTVCEVCNEGCGICDAEYGCRVVNGCDL